MIRILAIGNSFSVDALVYLKNIADAAGIESENANLCIGGCTLEKHAENIRTDAHEYEYYLNGQLSELGASINEKLREQKWDIVTIQQASPYSGRPESYEPFGKQVLDCIMDGAPDAEVWFQKTWAYEHDFESVGYQYYGSSQKRMYECICGTVAEFADRYSLMVIPSGDVIQKLREEPCFDYLNGGMSLCRDRMHMSETYGRYAVSATWFEMLLGGDIRGNSFAPADTSPEIISVVQRVVHEVCETVKRK